MLSGLLLSTGATAPQAGLELPLLWLLVHAVAAGVLIGLIVLMRRGRLASCQGVFLAQLGAALVLAVGEYLVLHSYLPDLAGSAWIGLTALVGLLLLVATALGLILGGIVWNLTQERRSKAWSVGRTAITLVLLAAAFSGLLGGSQRLLLQGYRPDAADWLGAIFFGSLASLVVAWLGSTFLRPIARFLPAYVFEFQFGDNRAERTEGDEGNRLLALQLLTLEILLFLGAGVGTGLVLLRWFG